MGTLVPSYGAKGSLVLGLTGYTGSAINFELFFIHENGKRYRYSSGDIDVRLMDNDLKFKGNCLVCSFGLSSGIPSMNCEGNVSNYLFFKYPQSPSEAASLSEPEKFIIKTNILKVMLIDKRFMFDEKGMYLRPMGPKEQNA